jgi:hypothetical protein
MKSIETLDFAETAMRVKARVLRPQPLNTTNIGTADVKESAARFGTDGVRVTGLNVRVKIASMEPEPSGTIACHRY